MGLLEGGRTRTAETYGPNLAEANRIVLGDEHGPADPDQSQRLLEALRTADPEAAGALVHDALQKGAASATVWDGLRLSAFELVLRAPGILSLHAVTSLNGFSLGAGHTRDQTTRGLLMGQAASWIAMFRNDIADNTKDLMERATIDGVEDQVGPPREFDPEMVGLLIRKGRTHHDYKFSAAVLDEAQACHPHWHARLRGTSGALLHKASDADGRVFTQARSLLGG
jgi:hypothetical protein